MAQRLVWRAARLMTLLSLGIALFAADPGASIHSVEASADVSLTADPDSQFWRPVSGVFANHDNMAAPVRKGTMEIRSRWTERNLYLLFVCDFDSLNLKPHPDTNQETFGLWNWDVAEAFIGDDFQNINLYKEFEVSPQGEWIDLDIDSKRMSDSSDAWRWESGFKVKARVDDAKKIWYAEMRIPFSAISRKPAKPGLELRINFFRAAGREPNRLLLTWQPTLAPTFHVPAAFGILHLSAAAETR